MGTKGDVNQSDIKELEDTDISAQTNNPNIQPLDSLSMSCNSSSGCFCTKSTIAWGGFAYMAVSILTIIVILISANKKKKDIDKDLSWFVISILCMFLLGPLLLISASYINNRNMQYVLLAGAVSTYIGSTVMLVRSIFF